MSQDRSDSIGKVTKNNETSVLKLEEKSIKHYLGNATKNGITTNKQCWTNIRPFLTNEGIISNNEIFLEQVDHFVND